jgi:hypothetical protein
MIGVPEMGVNGEGRYRQPLLTRGWQWESSIVEQPTEVIRPFAVAGIVQYGRRDRPFAIESGSAEKRAVVRHDFIGEPQLPEARRPPVEPPSIASIPLVARQLICHFQFLGRDREFIGRDPDF